MIADDCKKSINDDHDLWSFGWRGMAFDPEITVWRVWTRSKKTPPGNTIMCFSAGAWMEYLLVIILVDVDLHPAKRPMCMEYESVGWLGDLESPRNFCSKIVTFLLWRSVSRHIFPSVALSSA